MGILTWCIRSNIIRLWAPCRNLHRELLTVYYTQSQFVVTKKSSETPSSFRIQTWRPAEPGTFSFVRAYNRRATWICVYCTLYNKINRSPVSGNETLRCRRLSMADRRFSFSPWSSLCYKMRNVLRVRVLSFAENRPRVNEILFPARWAHCPSMIVDTVSIKTR